MADGDSNKNDLQAEIAAAVAAATAPLTERIGALNAQLEAVTAKKPEPVQEWSRSQLDQAVRDGKITEDTANAIWDKQAEQRTERLVDAKVMDLAARAETVRQIDEYTAIVPELLQEGSADRSKVRAKYEALIKQGFPANKATELVAVQTVYGPIEVVKAARGRSRTEETHEDVGGGGSSAGADDAPKGLKLTADEKRYYQSGIDKGIYKDWKAVEDELKFANQRLRQKHGAR